MPFAARNPAILFEKLYRKGKSGAFIPFVANQATQELRASGFLPVSIFQFENLFYRQAEDMRDFQG